MRLSPKIHQILDILSDGRFHSGELIGQAIGISRERVSVYIRELRSKGVQVFSLQRKGYSLPAPAELLDEKTRASAARASSASTSSTPRTATSSRG